MGSFKKFLSENEELFAKIQAELDELNDEELDELGYTIYNEFFDDDDEDESDEEEEFSLSDIISMVKELGPDLYEDILDLLSDDDEEEEVDEAKMKGENPCWDGYVMVGTKMKDGKEVPNCVPEEDVTEEMLEAMSRRMKPKNMNRRKRKFMKNTKAIMRRTKASRKKAARQNKAKRKRYYRANKAKIKAYQKSRSAAIKKGKHKVKVRKSA